MPGRPRIEVEEKPQRDLRKLARALLLLVEQQTKDGQAPAPAPKGKRP